MGVVERGGPHTLQGGNVMAWSDDWKARREQPCYALCRAGTGGWFWVAWTKMPRSDYDPDGSEPNSLTPDVDGMAPTAEAAMVAARSAVGLPAFQGPCMAQGVMSGDAPSMVDAPSMPPGCSGIRQ